MQETLYRVYYKQFWDSTWLVESRIVSLLELQQLKQRKDIKVISEEPFRLYPDDPLIDY